MLAIKQLLIIPKSKNSEEIYCMYFEVVFLQKKKIDIEFSCSCPVIDNEFCHNIIKVVCR